MFCVLSISLISITSLVLTNSFLLAFNIYIPCLVSIMNYSSGDGILIKPIESDLDKSTLTFFDCCYYDGLFSNVPLVFSASSVLNYLNQDFNNTPFLS